MLATELQIRTVLGIPIHAATRAEVLQVCEDAIDSRTQLLISVVNAAKIVSMQRHDIVRRAVLEGDLVLADGTSVVWASRFLRKPLPERIAGVDLFMELLKLAAAKGHRVYFLGADQIVLEEAMRQAQTRYPNLRIAGSRHGYFDESESADVAEGIRRSGADMLFVGITSPKKELFLSSFAATLGVPVCHGVGGSFDVLAGKVKRAPAFWQRAGLEWLYRVLQEPRRLWKRYLITNSVFIWMVLSEFVGGARARTAMRG